MIKLGCFSFVKDKRENNALWDPERFIDFAQDIKLDVVDFDLGKGFKSNDPEYLMKIRTKCLKAGLPIGFIDGTGGFVGGEAERRAQVEGAKERVDQAVFIGAPMVLLSTGGVPDGPIWGPMIECYQEVCDYAYEKGVMIGMRNHPPVTEPTGDEILKVYKLVNRPNFTFSMDVGRWKGSPGGYPKGNPDPSIDFYKFMEQTIPISSYVRAKIFKIDTGRELWFDYPRIMKILKSVNYNGIVSIYYLGNGYSDVNDPEGITLAAAHLRDMIEKHAY